MLLEKQKMKIKNEKKLITDGEFFHSFLIQFIFNEDLTKTYDMTNKANVDAESMIVEEEPEKKVYKLIILMYSIISTL